MGNLSFGISSPTFGKMRNQRVQGMRELTLLFILLLYPSVVALSHSGRCEAEGSMGEKR